MKHWCLAVLLLAGMPPTGDASGPDEGIRLYEARRFAEAETALRIRLAREPDNPAVLFHLGKVAIRLGDYPAATLWLERAVAHAPLESEHHHWLGNSLAWAAAAAPLHEKAELGRRCLAAYQRALELDPANLRARFSLMNFYRHVPRMFGGGMGRARAEADEIRRRDPVQGLHAEAVLQAHEQNYAAAFALLDEVRRLDPEHYAAQVLTGRLAAESGHRRAEGVAALRRCLELEPAETDESHEVVREYLAKLNPPKPRREVMVGRP